MFHALAAQRRGRRCWDFIKARKKRCSSSGSIIRSRRRSNFFGGATFLETNGKKKRRFDRFDVDDCWTVPQISRRTYTSFNHLSNRNEFLDGAVLI